MNWAEYSVFIKPKTLMMTLTYLIINYCYILLAEVLF